MSYLLLLGCALGVAAALAPSQPTATTASRRQFVVETTAAAAAAVTTRRTVGSTAAVVAAVTSAATLAAATPVTPLNTNPEGFLTLPGAPDMNPMAVGFGLYKTSPAVTEEAVTLALDAGVRHFDTASEYGNEVELGKALGRWAVGGRNRYRDEICVTTKLANRDQSTDPEAVKKAVKESIARLNIGYADSVLLHSPLTDKARRLASWQALLELREEGLVRSVGCCNFGTRALDEIEAAFPGKGPQMLQLELSPYNQHKDCVAWCEARGVPVVCGAWSQLSGSFNWGSDDEYRALQAVAKAHSATKAQILVRWAVQRGFGALPRSGVGSAAEKLAIRQNSGRGVSSRGWYAGPAEETWGGGALTREEMASLDGLDQQLAAGRLGRTDGWAAADVSGVDWDPTTVV